jgi:hypothetical protein
LVYGLHGVQLHQIFWCGYLLVENLIRKITFGSLLRDN